MMEGVSLSRLALRRWICSSLSKGCADEVSRLSNQLLLRAHCPFISRVSMPARLTGSSPQIRFYSFTRIHQTLRVTPAM